VAQVSEHLPSKREALSSNASITKKKKEESELDPCLVWRPKM
jgi:hypothetical protein